MVVQAYLFLVKKLDPATESAGEIQITSVKSASPAAPVPETRAPNFHQAPLPEESEISLDQPASVPVHINQPRPSQNIIPPVPMKMMGKPALMPNSNSRLATSQG